jgi:Tfp pilus assembly protein PilV
MFQANHSMEHPHNTITHKDPTFGLEGWTLKKGFTLIETFIVIALTVLVVGALSQMIHYFYVNNDYVLQEGGAVQSASQGLSTAIRALREASYGDDGSYPLASAATSSVTFYADVYGTGDVEEVQDYLSGTTLYQAVTYATGSPPTYVGQPASTSTIATYVRNSTSTPIFQYYDDTGTLLTQPVNVANIASIMTTLQIDVDPNRSPSVYLLIGSATLRNL